MSRPADKQTIACSFEGCDRPARTKGLCNAHYTQLNRGQPLKPLRLRDPALRPVGSPCSFPECGRPVVARGLCRGHYSQARAGKELRPLRPATNEGRHVGSDGYVFVRDYSRERFASGNYPYRAEHRVIMERHIGRPLLPHETVHHKNGMRDQNRLGNLELWSSSQPAGQRWQDKLAWAREIVALYGDWEAQRLFPEDTLD